MAGGIALAAFGMSRWARAEAKTVPSPTPGLPPSIRVHLFSGLGVSRVEVSGSAPLDLSIGSATRTLPSIAFDATGALTGELTNLSVGDAPVTIRSAAPLTVNAFSQTASLALHHYDSPIVLQRSGAAVLAVNLVELESYVGATLASEISPSWPPESLKAQAIVARTYAVHAAAHSAGRPYDVTDDTSNQVFAGLDGIVPVFTAATTATAGMTLQAAGQPADVFYSATCGGHTADAQELTGRPSPPYLQGIPDSENGGKPYCTPSPFFAWENTVKATDLARVVGDLADIQVKDRWNDGRAKTVRVVRTEAGSYDMD
ncbi:MAG: SpoIID/LytB domain-containing protein, partial [Candidatus Eremiobacteraeota bacterium]|nr:SpoIID/LytB domain-containing protein [Candidatus Eremiobacteraeota bacterium]